ncbi:MAG TPA: methyltransferase domain-containing protein [Rhizomicrobium sp.]|nr:methyltransferase domain-containing protein [Rhizomicrobium sp.]
MQIDAHDLSAFYAAPMGQVTRRLIARRLKRLWPEAKKQRILGYGFAPPYLTPFQGEAERVIALMPAQQGVVVWPAKRPLSVLGEENALPFPDAMFDRILIVHGLEAAEAARPLMRQIWRVLAPSGKLIIIAPNRRSLWARVESSPFAQGRPFTRGQLSRLLNESMFVPERWDTALLFPLRPMRSLVRSGTAWERIGRALWPRLAGVHIVEAQKSLYALAAPSPVKNAKAALANAAG